MCEKYDIIIKNILLLYLSLFVYDIDYAYSSMYLIMYLDLTGAKKFKGRS